MHFTLIKQTYNQNLTAESSTEKTHSKVCKAARHLIPLGLLDTTLRQGGFHITNVNIDSIT
jgi:hypothetical protein